MISGLWFESNCTCSFPVNICSIADLSIAGYFGADFVIHGCSRNVVTNLAILVIFCISDVLSMILASPFFCNFGLWYLIFYPWSISNLWFVISDLWLPDFGLHFCKSWCRLSMLVSACCYHLWLMEDHLLCMDVLCSLWILSKEAKFVRCNYLWSMEDQLQSMDDQLLSIICLLWLLSRDRKSVV